MPGVHLRRLASFRDPRGVVVECFQPDWPQAIAPAQWVTIVTAADTLRGMHVHLRHTDWLVVADGRILVALHDLRPGSPTRLQSELVVLDGAEPAALRIPPGVAHGLFAPQRSVALLGADRPYDLADELGYHWRDPALGIAWPTTSPRVSARDEAMPPLRALLPSIPAWTAPR